MSEDSAPSPPPPLPRRNWFGRNRKWLLPSGCLFLFLLAIGFAAGIFFLVVGVMKESGAYKMAVTRARENPAVIEALGTPITEGWMPSGSAHSVGAGGDAYNAPSGGRSSATPRLYHARARGARPSRSQSIATAAHLRVQFYRHGN